VSRKIRDTENDEVLYAVERVFDSDGFPGYATKTQQPETITTVGDDVSSIGPTVPAHDVDDNRGDRYEWIDA
jgi:hypothetical protein